MKVVKVLFILMNLDRHYPPVTMPTSKQMMDHKTKRGGQYEAVADPQRMCEAPGMNKHVILMHVSKIVTV